MYDLKCPIRSLSQQTADLHRLPRGTSLLQGFEPATLSRRCAASAGPDAGEAGGGVVRTCSARGCRGYDVAAAEAGGGGVAQQHHEGMEQ